MSQCVPSWDFDDNPPPPPRNSLRSHSNATAPDASMSDYEVAELTWENGQVAMHGLGLPRLPSKPPSWDKPRATGTLESIVNQATGTNLPRFSKLPFDNTLTSATGGGTNNELVTWFDHHRSVATSGAPSNTVTMDALVPCRNNQSDEPNSSHLIDSLVSVPGVLGSSAGTGLINGCSTRVGSCSVAAAHGENTRRMEKHAASVARVPSTPEWNSRSPSVSGSATFGLDSQQVTLDTKGSDRDSACHSRLQREASDQEERKKRCTGKSSVSTKRSRAAAIHNQSERKRRDKINQRMKTLQKLVPNSSKTDKASMLDEVIEYLKQLQAQVHVISRMNMPAMMLPMAMQQQLQMSMMAPRNMGMGIGMGMGMGMPGIGMDMNNIALPNIAGVPPVLHPTAFMAPMTSWDGSAGGADPLSAYLACQSQPMSMEAYSMMAAMYQQFHQQPAPSPSSSKS
ncbi:PREDICTED: transcription factor UNE10 [Fragaria vesca subsp. vesca]|uniref:transcription factor UNE10 n=1 Tax=Fragaria vesca subsp. vesca TaxID=101020 RepID=UPI0002C36C48|nr:PREDICTED: transcription factor UNE10 [Fragaria vesca subsp. vesca]